MKSLKSSLFLLIVAVAFAACNNTTTTPVVAVDPLPSWNDGTVKQAIVNYVTAVTTEGSPNFVPVDDRIATFDNDGTLWPEQPFIQGEFAFYRAAQMIKEKPELVKKQPFKAIAEKDRTYFEKGGLKAVFELLVATQTGMDCDAFKTEVQAFFKTFSYPKYDVSGPAIAYAPQVELLKYLRANGFKTYICSGGDIDFIRAIAPDFYGIPSGQVIGSAVKYQYTESNRTILRVPAMWRTNDQQTKPEGIQLHIGKRPIFACGNERSSGDIQMLEYSQSSTYPSLQLMVNHNDADREFAYQEADSASLKAAAKNHWLVVDMKTDWNKIFGK